MRKREVRETREAIGIKVREADGVGGRTLLCWVTGTLQHLENDWKGVRGSSEGGIGGAREAGGHRN
jgi:hypothetical protein